MFNKTVLGYPQHLNYVAALPWKTLVNSQKFRTFRVRKMRFECELVRAMIKVAAF